MKQYQLRISNGHNTIKSPIVEAESPYFAMLKIKKNDPFLGQTYSDFELQDNIGVVIPAKMFGDDLKT